MRPVRWRAVVVGLACATSIAGPAAAQGVPPSVPPRLTSCGRDASGLGRITGQLIADSAGIKLSRGVVIRSPMCMTQSDAGGGFVLRGLPPGEYTVSVGDLWVAPIAPVVVHVAADSSSMITFHLKPENRTLECAAVPECATLLEPPPAGALVALSDTDRVREAAYRMAITMIRRPVAGGAPATQPAYCLAAGNFTTTASTAVIDIVRLRFPTARPLDGCDRGPPGRPTQYFIAGTHDRAFIVVVRDVLVNGDTATASAVGDGTGWACTFRRTAAGWRPTSCRTTVVS